MSKALTIINTTGIEFLLKLSEKRLFTHIKDIVLKKYPDARIGKDYIVTGQGKPLVCVHLDTVSPIPPMYVKRIGNTLTAPFDKCLGADDRAGVWIALQMIEHGTKTDFNYGFFCGEEAGGVGSTAYAVSTPEPEHTAFIGLDRASKKGKQNTATYGYDNDTFLKLFPYPEGYGTMSDCSILAEHLEKACVNLSVGYQNEHTKLEVLNLTQMQETLDVMKNIVIPVTDYPAESQPYWKNYGKFSMWGTSFKAYGEPVTCDFCGQHALLYDCDGERLCSACKEYTDWKGDRTI